MDKVSAFAAGVLARRAGEGSARFCSDFRGLRPSSWNPVVQLGPLTIYHLTTAGDDDLTASPSLPPQNRLKRTNISVCDRDGREQRRSPSTGPDRMLDASAGHWPHSRQPGVVVGAPQSHCAGAMAVYQAAHPEMAYISGALPLYGPVFP